MQITKLVVLILFLAIGNVCRASQDEGSPILYNFMSETNVYLWVSRADQQPTIATINNGKWDIPNTALNNPRWKQLISSIVSGDFSYQDKWAKFLEKLRLEYPDTTWAKPRFPNIEMYVRIRSKDSVAVQILMRPDFYAEYAFVKKETWAKSADIPTDKILNLPYRDPNLTNIFNKEATAHKWVDSWHKWIESRIEEQDSIRSIMYADKDGKSLWIIQERVTESNWVSRSMRKMPPKPILIEKTDVVEVKKTDVLMLLIVAAFSLLLGFVSPWRLSFIQRLIPLLYRRKKPQIPNVDDVSSGHFEQRLTGVNRTRPIVAENKIQKIISSQANIEKLYQIFTTYEKRQETFLINLHEQLESLFTELHTNTLEEYGVDGLQSDEAKLLLSLGTSAKECLRKLDSFIAQDRFPANLFSNDAHATWLNEIPVVLVSLNDQLSKAKHQSSATRDKLLATSEELNQTKNQLRELQDVNNQLVTKVSKLEQEYGNIRRQQEELNSRMEDLHKVESLAVYLEQGEGYVLAQTDNPEQAAIVSFLSTYALFHLWGATLNKHSEKREVMLANIYSIADKLRSYRGFDVVLNEVDTTARAVNELETLLGKSQEKHHIAHLFQVLLRRLRDISSVDLAPYYIGLDKYGKLFKVA
ncbi:MAG: hypothetical protein HY707_04685 [Ignavibacteriae bacterium]|nr:hypothetical protein [Ignavibacteriota bacterium]